MEKNLYNLKMQYARKEGKKEGRKEGRKEGIAEGQKDKARKVAKKLLENNINIEIIINSTGLTKEEIEKL